MNIKSPSDKRDRSVNIVGVRLSKPRSSKSRTEKSWGKKYWRGAFFALAS